MGYAGSEALNCDKAPLVNDVSVVGYDPLTRVRVGLFYRRRLLGDSCLGSTGSELKWKLPIAAGSFAAVIRDPWDLPKR